jgi:hypothetical protein
MAPATGPGTGPEAADGGRVTRVSVTGSPSGKKRSTVR